LKDTITRRADAIQWDFGPCRSAGSLRVTRRQGLARV